jgi:hypothetical protein
VIPIFVVVLQGSQRFEALKYDLNRQAIPFVVEQAVNGSYIKEEQLEFLFDRKGTFARLGYDISKSLLGCALSHRAVYLKGYDCGSDWIVVLEEDVRLQENFLANLNLLLNNFQSDGPLIIQLFTRGERFIKKKSIQGIVNERYIFQFASPPGQTAGYLINREALHLAIKDKEILGAPDWPSWAAQVDFFGTFPFLVFENGEGSSIGPSPLSRKGYWIRNLEKCLGFHFFRFHAHYSSSRIYLKTEIKPLMLRTLWTIRGKPTFPSENRNGLWLV